MAPIRNAFPPPAAYTALPAGKSSSPHPARAAYDTGPTLAGLPPGGRRRTEEQPFPPANLPPCIPHGLRTTPGRRSPACPRRATPHRRAALSAAVTGHRPRPASAAVPGCPLRLRRQTAPRQNNPASAVAFAIGLYYLYRRQTAPRQNNPASAVAFALGLYYLYRRQTAPRQNNPASAVAFALGLYYLCQRTNAYPL